jgi:Domain of Unknown Function (DUF928)
MTIVSQSTRFRLICASFAAAAWTLGIAPAYSFDPPPGEGTPVRTIGGSTRSGHGACRTQPAEGLPWGAPQGLMVEPVTAERRAPSAMWVYLPTTQATHLELSLFDRAGNGLYQTLMAVPSGPTTLDLPTTTHGPGDYWTLALVCNPRDRTQDWVISGPIPPSSSAQPTPLRLFLIAPLSELAKGVSSSTQAATK